MFGAAESQKDTFLEHTKAARSERALEKKRENAAILIQSQIRGFITRRKYKQNIR